MTTDPLDGFIEDPAAMVQAWARPVVDQRVGQLERQISQLQTDTIKQRVISALDADPMLAGKWRTQNEDPAFLGWLNGLHEFAGVPRLTLLRRAFEAGDTTRVANFFRAFIAQQLPERQRTAHRLPLEQPSKAAIRSADLKPRRIWTRVEIERFYRDVAAGRYDGAEAERLRIEQEIVAAARERRVANPPLQTRDGK
jgi:hypothetical protein